MKHRQRGFTITELMITIGLSLSVISSVLIGYLATYSSSMSTLAASKLNQDMSALMNLMVNELRRAGYSGVVPTTPASNLFAAVDNTALEVFDNMTLNAQQAATGSGSCIVYSYDMDKDGVVDAAELAGFRLTTTGVVQMRTSGNTADPDTCATASNTWTDLTDPDFVTVSALTFNLANSNCLNTREPDSVNNDLDASTDEADEANCYVSVPVAASGNITVETREITITLTGTLTNDTFVRLTQTQNVRVRNDMVRVY
jgi:prepilin peptidase dependent protein B